MDIPGTEEDYKLELSAVIKSDYDQSQIESKRFDRIYTKYVDGVIFEKTNYIGLIDGRSITPESLEESRKELVSKVSDQRSFWDGIGHAPKLLIVGVTDEISSDTRKYVKEQPDALDYGNYMQEILVVDVSAGTILKKEGHQSVGSIGDKIEREYLQEPL